MIDVLAPVGQVSLRRVRVCLWLYIILILLEGPLRKWLVPGLSNPLLLLRDPVALLAIVWGWGLLRRSAWAPLWEGLAVLSLLSFASTLVLGHQDLPTAIFGLRIWILHFPLIFLYAEAFTVADVWRVARLLLILALPMALLMYLQGTLPEAHFLNRGPAGEGSTALFGGAAGIPRPPGIFTFVNGLVAYLGLCLAMAIAWILGGPRPIPYWLWFSVIALAASLPLSISRTLLFLYILVGIGAAAFILLARRSLVRIFIYGLTIVLLLIPMAGIPQLQPFYHAFQVRWEDANRVEGGDAGVGGVLMLRVFDPFLSPLHQAWVTPLLGKGLGLSTSIGAIRLSGKTSFLAGEQSWEATINEMGPFLGMGVLLIRVVLTGSMLILSLTQALQGNPLPLLLATVVLQAVLSGPLIQPIVLSFTTIGGGLLLAACRSRPSGIPCRAYWVHTLPL